MRLGAEAQGQSAPDELVGIWRIANLQANLTFYYPNSTNPVVYLQVERP